MDIQEPMGVGQSGHPDELRKLRPGRYADHWDFVASFGTRVSDSIAQAARAGTLADIAPVVAFLMSDAARIRGAHSR